MLFDIHEQASNFSQEAEGTAARTPTQRDVLFLFLGIGKCNKNVYALVFCIYNPLYYSNGVLKEHSNGHQGPGRNKRTIDQANRGVEFGDGNYL